MSEVDCLRRAARLGVPAVAGWLGAFDSPLVLRFSSAIGGRVRRLRTQKRPFLFQDVATVWSRWSCGSLVRRRDATAIVLGFFYGMRAAELAAVRRRDVSLLSGGVVRVTFASRKTCRSVLGTHEPQVIHARHPLLSEAIGAWLQILDAQHVDRLSPLFPRLLAGASSLSSALLRPASFRAMVKRAQPSCVAHSLRVGMATEAWAAGVPLEAIMALGGWTSSAAVLYIVGVMEETVHASSLLGAASVRFTADGLHAQLGTSRLRRGVWITPEHGSPRPVVDVNGGMVDGGGHVDDGMVASGRKGAGPSGPR